MNVPSVNRWKFPSAVCRQSVFISQYKLSKIMIFNFNESMYFEMEFTKEEFLTSSVVVSACHLSAWRSEDRTHDQLNPIAPINHGAVCQIQKKDCLQDFWSAWGCWFPKIHPDPRLWTCLWLMHSCSSEWPIYWKNIVIMGRRMSEVNFHWQVRSLSDLTWNARDCRQSPYDQ